MPGPMSGDHDQLDPAEALMREVGAQLRRVRMERGQDLDHVAQQLRIRPSYLSGIEQGDLSAMPGRTYALGFLRSYADYLGFDGDDLVSQIKSTVANLTDRTRLRVRTPLPESRLPRTPVLVLSLAAVAGIYTGWWYFNHGSQPADETVAEVPADLHELAAGASRGSADGLEPEPSDATPPTMRSANEPRAPERPHGATPTEDASSSGDAAADPANGGAAVEAPAPERTAALQPPPAPEPAATPTAPASPVRVPVTTAPPASAGSATTLATPPAPSIPAEAVPTPPADPAAHRDQLAALPLDRAMLGPIGQVFEPENTNSRVVLRAIESSWLRISSASGEYVRDHTLEPNDVLLVPNRPDLALWTGNAGGLQVIVDGTLLAPLGTSGAVIHGVSLEPSSLRTRLGPPRTR
jgi:cytoskeletal protein RodZ